MAKITDRMPPPPADADGWRAAGLIDDRTIPDLFRAAAERAPDRPFLIAPDGAVLTYGAARERVAAIAAGLAGEGIEPGDIVAVQLPNVAEFVLAYLAITSLGGAMQTLHMPYRRAEIAQLLGHSGAKAAILLTTFKDEGPTATALSLQRDLPSLATVVALGPDAPEGSVPFAKLAEGAGSRELPGIDSAAATAGAIAATAGADDAALLLYTSGTTANPKGVPIRHRGFAANARASVGEFGITPDDVILSAAPFSHLYGLFTLHLALAAGASIALLPAFAPPAFVEALASTGATMVFAGPAHFAACRAGGLLTPSAFAGVRLVCLSGSTVPPDLAAAVDANLGEGAVVQLWGMTELQAGSYGRPDDAPARRFGTAGRPSPGTSLRVVGDNGLPLGSEAEGRLEVRGPSVFTGYLDDPAATAAAFSADGWFATGDTARLTGDGDLVLTGRVKELINRGGVKYSPVEIEVEIERMPGVARAAIVPMPDPVLGERACVFVAAADGASPPSLADITRRLDAAGVAKYKWPERLELIAEMPLTPTQKVMRGRLAEILAGRLAPAPDAPTGGR